MTADADAAVRGRYKFQVGLLSACWALATTGNVLLVSVSSLVGDQLADDKSLATLPAALMWIGTATATIPASFLMRAMGRRFGFMTGAMIGAVGATIAAFAVYNRSFVALCIGIALIGAYNGFNYYYRFAAAETAPEEFRSRAISLVLAGGIAAAIVGPTLAVWANELFSPILFMGPFVVIAAIAVIIILLVSFTRIPRPPVQTMRAAGRPLAVIARQPAFLVAVAGGVVAYGVMILLMTVTPLAMVACNHGFTDAARVIQWHVLGMFAPSFFTGRLIRRFGTLTIMLWGAIALLACIAVALSGISVAHFWIALTLLGLGWNFLFIGATTLLTETHTVAERAKTQGLNEFLVFGIAGIGSFASGNLHYYFGWSLLNIVALVPVAAILMATLWLVFRRRAEARLADPGE